MSITKSKKEKIEKMEILFDEIKKLFPNSSMNLNIHGIDMKQLPEKWKIKVNRNYNSSTGELMAEYKTATRMKGGWDIVLFS